MRFNSAALALVLAGCGGEIATSPDTFPVDPIRVAHLRAPQAVGVRSGVTADTKKTFTSDAGTWVANNRQLTDTAVVMLTRTLEKRGIAPGAAKSVTLRVQARSLRAVVLPPVVSGNARLTLEAAFGDGTSAVVEGEGGAPVGVERAFEAALQSALFRLVNEPAFIAYINK